MRNLLPILIVMIGLLGLVPEAGASEQLNTIAVAHGAVNNQYLSAYLTNPHTLECRVIDAYGVSSGSSVTISSGLCYNPTVAYDSDLNQFLVAWSEYANDKYSVQAMIVLPNGALSGNTISIASDLAWKPGTRVVYSPNSQRYLVVFTNGSSIEAQYINGAGTLYGKNFDALPGSSHENFSYADNPAIAYDSVNHHFLVTGLIFGNGYPPMSLYGSMVDDIDSIAMYKAPFVILDSWTYLYPPAIAFDSANKRFLVIWELYTGAGHELHGQLVNADATLSGTDITIKPERTVAFATDIIYQSGNGRFLAAWLDERSAQLAIYAKELNANGTDYASDFLLASPAYQYNLGLTYNAQFGNTLLAYGANGNYANGYVVWPVAIPPNLMVSPSVGTIGTVIEIKGNGFGVKKGKVSLAGADKPCALTVTSWNENGNGVIHAVVNKVPPAGTYDVVVQPNGPKGTPAITEAKGFKVAPPEITSWKITSPGFITMEGNYFGTKKGIVTLNDTGEKPLKCKVLTWDMDTTTGESEATLSYKQLPAGGYYLWLTNKAGTDYLD